MKDLKIKLGIIVSFIFFTGCGGGGGGGGGNVTVRPTIPNPPSIVIPNINDGSYDIGAEINTDNPISRAIDSFFYLLHWLWRRWRWRRRKRYSSSNYSKSSKYSNSKYK